MTYVARLFLQAQTRWIHCHNRSILQLGLALDSRYHEVSDVAGSLVEVVAHALGAEALADNVPLKTVLVDHISHSVIWSVKHFS